MVILIPSFSSSTQLHFCPDKTVIVCCFWNLKLTVRDVHSCLFYFCMRKYAPIWTFQCQKFLRVTDIPNPMSHSFSEPALCIMRAMRRQNWPVYSRYFNFTIAAVCQHSTAADLLRLADQFKADCRRPLRYPLPLLRLMHRTRPTGKFTHHSGK